MFIHPDGIPDWVLYILLAPFVPIAGFIHYSLGIAQALALTSAITWRIISYRKHPGQKLKIVRCVYLPWLLAPNLVVIAWGILTDPLL